MQHPYYRLTQSRGMTLLVTASLLVLVACNSTSSIDTTLGTVAPSQQSVLLPPPAVPDGTAAQQAETVFTPPAAAPVAPPAAPTIVEAAPTVPAAQQEPAVADDLVPNITQRNTGTFPNINEERQPSLRQFTPDEQARLTAYMSQLRQQHSAGAISTVQYQRQLTFLQNLARTHSRDALRQIGAL